VLDAILAEQYSDWNKEYSDDELYNFYKTKGIWINKSIEEIKEHYNKTLRPSRRIYPGHICNKYKHEFKDAYNNNQTRTRYSTALLFGGM
jgi:hypothetical protein